MELPLGTASSVCFVPINIRCKRSLSPDRHNDAMEREQKPKKYERVAL